MTTPSNKLKHVLEIVTPIIKIKIPLMLIMLSSYGRVFNVSKKQRYREMRGGPEFESYWGQFITL